MLKQNRIFAQRFETLKVSAEILRIQQNLNLKTISSCGNDKKINSMSTIAKDFGMDEALKQLGLKDVNYGTSTGNKWFKGGDEIASYSPVDGALIGKVTTTSKEEYEQVITTAQEAFLSFRAMPAPQRGEIVRQFGNKLRELKEPL